MDKDTVLIVMPVYNAERTLRGAIKSILSQVYKNLHLVIVDDCSTDSSLAIARSFLPDPRVSVFKNNKNMGAYYCRNFGLYIYRNEPWGYFSTHDSDDISYKHRINTLVKILSKSSAYNGIQDIFVRRDIETKEVISKDLTLAHAVFKRAAFDAVGYFDSVKFGGDWDHWVRLKHYNAKHGFSQRSLRVKHGDSFVHDKNLTVLIPIGSKKRLDYIKKCEARIKKMEQHNNYYLNFIRPKGVTTKVRK